MNAQAAAKQAPTPQTPPLPEASPQSLGLSPARLARMSDAFKREIDKGTVPGVTVLVARHGQVGWFEALGRQSPTGAAPMARPAHLSCGARRFRKRCADHHARLDRYRRSRE